MRDRLPCEFFLLRYVPDVVKGEFVNIGVLLREAAGADLPAGLSAPRAAAAPRSLVRFTRDWARVRCLDAGADIGLLETLEQEIGARLGTVVSAREPKGVLEVLEDTLSNSIQMTEPRATLAENLATEMEELMRLYVEPLKVSRARTRSGRATIAAAVRSQFEQAGVWPLLRKRIAVASYTRAGDPMKIDCGYRPLAAQVSGESIVRLFQAVSLEADVEAAKGLAYTAPQMREGVARVEGARLELTAVVEPLREVGQVDDEQDEGTERYRFGVDAMEREAIRVVTVADLARVAATARRELGLT